MDKCPSMGIGGRMKVKQIIPPIEQYFICKTKIAKEKQALNWELINTGESEITEQIRKQIALDKESLGKFLDMEV